MAKHEPLINTLFGGSKSKKTSVLTAKMEKEEAYIRAEREKNREISSALTDVRITLKELEHRYQDIFDKELRTARRNANRGTKDSNNYARIGVAYYSKQVVSAAQKRLADMTSSFEVSSSIDELASTLRLVNELPKVIGRVDVSGLNKAARKMDSAAGSSGGDLIEALSRLSGLKLDGPDTGMVSELVSADEIEKWIQDQSYAEECFEEGSGAGPSGSQLLDAGAELLRVRAGQGQEEKEAGTERTFDSSLAALKRMTDSL